MSGILPGWSHLPPELLLLIAQDHLTSAVDIVRLRCVCASWRSIVSAVLIPPQLPWLLLYNKQTPSLSFFSPSDQKLCTLTLPNSDWNCILASSHGYLLLRKKKNPINPTNDGLSFSLFNPINKHLIPFPPLLLEREPPFNRTFIRKSVIGLTPAPLVAILTYTKLAFCILGKPDWRVIDIEFSHAQCDLAYHNGYFYLVTGSNLQVFDLKLSKKMSRDQRLYLPYRSDSSLHFVVSSGTLLLLAGSLSERWFNVYRVERGSEGMWSLVRKEVGDDDLFFVSCGNSVCVPAGGVSGWEERRGCYATEKFVVGGVAPEIHLARGGKDGFCLEWLPDQYYWHAPGAHLPDWRDVTRLAWFVPKLCSKEQLWVRRKWIGRKQMDAGNSEGAECAMD